MHTACNCTQCDRSSIDDSMFGRGLSYSKKCQPSADFLIVLFRRFAMCEHFAGRFACTVCRSTIIIRCDLDHHHLPVLSTHTHTHTNISCRMHTHQLSLPYTHTHTPHINSLNQLCRDCSAHLIVHRPHVGTHIHTQYIAALARRPP